MDRAHLIPKQRIKREVGKLSRADMDAVVWDDRVWVPACRWHHGQFDNYRFRIGRRHLPPGVEEFATEHGLVWSLMRDYQ